MGRFTFGLTLLFLRIAVHFIPQQKYAAQIDELPDMDEKDRHADLHGWQRKRVAFTTGKGFHYFYHYPSEKEHAPALVLLHGMILDGKTFFGFNPLADEFNLFAYDFPEQSPHYRGSMEDFVWLLDDFAAACSLDSFHLCGVSFGGRTASYYCAHKVGPAVPNVVLIATPIPSQSRRQQALQKQLGEWFQRLNDPQLYWVMKRLSSMYLRGLSRRERRRIRPLIHMKHPAFYRQVIGAIEGEDPPATARGITIPSLYVQSGKKTLFPSLRGKAFHATIPSSAVEVVPNASHVMVITHTPTILAAMRKFYHGRASITSPRLHQQSTDNDRKQAG